MSDLHVELRGQRQQLVGNVQCLAQGCSSSRADACSRRTVPLLVVLYKVLNRNLDFLTYRWTFFLAINYSGEVAVSASRVQQPLFFMLQLLVCNEFNGPANQGPQRKLTNKTHKGKVCLKFLLQQM